MTLFDLRQQIDLAIAQGAEDHDTVFVDQLIEQRYESGDCERSTEPIEPARLTLERNGRRELFIR